MASHLVAELLAWVITHPAMAFVIGLGIVIVLVFMNLGQQAGIGTPGYRNGR